MSSENNGKLKDAISELRKALESSLGNKNDCTKAIAQIEGTITSIEQKLTELTSSAQTQAANPENNEQNNLGFAINAETANIIR